MHLVRETKPHSGICVICQIFGILQHSSLIQPNYPLMNTVQNKPNIWFYLIPHGCILNTGVDLIHTTRWSSESWLICNTYTGIWQQVKRFYIYGFGQPLCPCSLVSNIKIPSQNTIKLNVFRQTNDSFGDKIYKIVTTHIKIVPLCTKRTKWGPCLRQQIPIIE